MQTDGPISKKREYKQPTIARDLNIRVTPHEIRLLSARSERLNGKSEEATSLKAQHLPEDWVYDNIKDAIYHCRRIYYIYLGILCYTLLTILTTPTLGFFREQIIKMPFMSAEMPLNYYLVLAPLLLIGFFIYKQLYLYKTNKLIKYAVDECKSLNKDNSEDCQGMADRCTLNCMCKRHLSRLYPWIIIYCRQVENRPGEDVNGDHLSSLVARFQQTFVSFSLWWLLPVILFMLSVFIIRKHSGFLSVYMLLVTVFGGSAVAFFWYQQQKFLGLTKPFFSLIRVKVIVAVSICILSILIGLNMVAFNGKLAASIIPWTESEVPLLPMALRNLVFADLSQQAIATKQTSDKPFWIDLKERHFEGANLSEAFLKKADLEGSCLHNAIFEGANLDNAKLDNAVANGADFRRAILSGVSLNNAEFIKADFSDANMTKANIIGANLVGADFNSTNLIGANFSSSSVKEADFSLADLSHARLFLTDVQHARFRGANFQYAELFAIQHMEVEQIKQASNYLLAYYDNAWLQKLGLGEDHNDRVEAKRFSHYNFERAKLNYADLRGADLINARLNQADMSRANLQGANLNGAELYRTNLKMANLEGISYTDYDQFVLVKTLYKARMDPELRRKLEQHYPNLFKKPDPLEEEKEEPLHAIK